MFKTFKYITFLTLTLLIINCADDNDDDYELTPVVLDLSLVPYQKLSDYKFFKGDLKNQEPAFGVLPYEPASQLFTDYAKKKRFIWMPNGSKMTYNGDHNLMNFPNKTVLIKNFYYDTMTTGNAKQILETRVMILKNGEWIFAEYQWNEEQTDAFLLETGENVPISFIHNGEVKTTSYRLPHPSECFVCHKSESNAVPIALKPQNLNWTYNYPEGAKNQLTKFIEFGYLTNNLPSNINSVIDYRDTSKSLELRIRSYLDINCGHCHNDLGDCEYREHLRLEFHKTANLQNMGVCVDANEAVDGSTLIIRPQRFDRSVMYLRMEEELDQSIMMPKLGRSIKHAEGLDLLKEYIISLNPCP
jgi:uncharacterized repeat protein (TIGR03806 family)